MGAPPGNNFNPAGRPVGAVNKATSKAREAIALFVDNNSDRLLTWLDAIALESPKDAFAAFMSVVEYHVPKLARIENTGKDGESLPPTVIIGSALDTLPDSVRAKLREALKDAAEEKG
jgi:hypothetical protein